MYSTAAVPATAAMTTPTTPVLTSMAVSAPTMPAAGRVKSQPRAIFPTMPQRTVVPLAAHARTDDGAGGHLCGGEGEAQVRGGEDGGGGAGFGGEALRGLHLGEPGRPWSG